jgi:hypothetical protein
MRALLVLGSVLALVGCGEDAPTDADAGPPPRDAAADARVAPPDAQPDPVDAGSDGGPVGPPGSAGCVDGAGLDEGEHTFELEGLTRRYVLRRPGGYTRYRAWPLVLALQGNGGSRST